MSRIRKQFFHVQFVEFVSIMFDNNILKHCILFWVLSILCLSYMITWTLIKQQNVEWNTIRFFLFE